MDVQLGCSVHGGSGRLEIPAFQSSDICSPGKIGVFRGLNAVNSLQEKAQQPSQLSALSPGLPGRMQSTATRPPPDTYSVVLRMILRMILRMVLRIPVHNVSRNKLSQLLAGKESGSIHFSHERISDKITPPLPPSLHPFPSSPTRAENDTQPLAVRYRKDLTRHLKIFGLSEIGERDEDEICAALVPFLSPAIGIWTLLRSSSRCRKGLLPLLTSVGHLLVVCVCVWVCV